MIPSLSALALAIAAAPAQPPGFSGPIAWTASPARAGGQPHVAFTFGRGNTTSVALDSAADLQPLRRALGKAGPVAFTLDREPGDLACTGTIAATGRGRGTCRFTADPGFAQDLAARGLPLRGREQELVSLAILGARLASVDALEAEGARPTHVDQFIAATALDVTAGYVRELKGAGLRIGSFEDLIACRALKVDAGYVRSLASAGYRSLSSHDIIAMKAVGVTGAYARSINAPAARP